MTLYRDIVVDQPLGYRPLLLDLLTPAGQGPFPLLVHIYGGGFAGGSHKTDSLGGYLVERCVPEGFAVARVQYRHSKEAIFPAQIHDVKAAVSWLRLHAAAVHIDPDRFASWGSSSGGHLSTMLAVSAGHPLLEGDQGSTTSSAVQAAISWNGPVNIGRLPPPPAESPFHQLGEDPHDWLLGAPASSAPELAAAASTSSYPAAAAAPLMLVHGELDCSIPIDQSEELAAAYRAVGAEVTLVRVPRAGHFFADGDRERLVTQGIQFLRRRLG